MCEQSNEFKIVEIKTFKLNYDGMYHITWSKGDKVFKWYVYLPIIDLLKMIEIEGLSLKDIEDLAHARSPIKFKKVTLKCELVDKSFKTYGFYEESYPNTLNNDGFVVELFLGDSIANHSGEKLLATFEIAE